MKIAKAFFLITLFILVIAFSAQAQSDNLKFAVISDVKVEKVASALEFIKAQDVDFIILAGDFCYDQQDYYPYFVEAGLAPTSQLAPDDQPIYFVMGNHDEAPAGELNFRNLIAPCYPTNGPSDAPTGTAYSFDRGGCHFVITNQYWQYQGGGYSEEQLDWINQDLAASSMPYKFVVGHEPAFPLERHVGDSLDIDPVMRDKFWKILADNNVQAFFCGHTHNLSHMLAYKVYQFNAGEVAAGHVCITIVEGDDNQAVVSSFENPNKKGLVERIANLHYLYHQTLVPQESSAAPTEKTVLFKGSSPLNSGTCFIDTIHL